MNGIERRVARLEKAEGETKIDVAAELIQRLAKMRAAKRRGDWVEPNPEEQISCLQERLEELKQKPMSDVAAELTERLILARLSKLRERYAHAQQD